MSQPREIASVPRSALARVLLAELAADPEAAADLAAVLTPYLPGREGDEWLSHEAAAAHLGVTSRALYALVRRHGIAYEQPTGPHGRRRYHRAELDRYVTGG